MPASPSDMLRVDDAGGVQVVLPVDMEIPAQRQMPKGALVLVMDPCEIPEGTYWGQQCATQAIAALGSRDDVGIVGFHFADGYKLELPLGPKGDASAAARVIKTMAEDDMPSLDDAVSLALNGQPRQSRGLISSDARYKHIIIISDGDPDTVSSTTIKLARENKVTISTVTAYPHTHGDLPPVMKDIAIATGGKFYGPLESDPSRLPQIFIKEAMIVKRSLIQEPDGGIPIHVRDAADELIGGITDFRPLRGMVLTSRKNDPKVEMPLSAGKMNDPILAHWQTGLGKSAVWTSDAHNKWSAAWVNSPDYAKL